MMEHTFVLVAIHSIVSNCVFDDLFIFCLFVVRMDTFCLACKAWRGSVLNHPAMFPHMFISVFVCLFIYSLLLSLFVARFG